ncbi:hypothetical protein [Methanococcus sp. CF]
MYPEVKRTYKPRVYTVKGRQPNESKRVEVYSMTGECLGVNELKVHNFIVQDCQEKYFSLKTESNGLEIGDNIEVMYCYGKYNVKKVDTNG